MLGDGHRSIKTKGAEKMMTNEQITEGVGDAASMCAVRGLLMSLQDGMDSPGFWKLMRIKVYLMIQENELKGECSHEDAEKAYALLGEIGQS